MENTITETPVVENEVKAEENGSLQLEEKGLYGVSIMDGLGKSQVLWLTGRELMNLKELIRG